MIEAYRKYTANGFSCLPTNENKEPPLGVSWLNSFSENSFKDTHGIGLKCGIHSNGLECIDFDNHFGDAPEVIKEYLSNKDVSEIYKKYKLPIESTVRGGFHLLFRSDNCGANKKLARKVLDGKPTAFIETKGNNGYFVASPSPGYDVIRNDIFVVAKISNEDRDILIREAEAMNEYVEENKYVASTHVGDDRPGDIYNETLEAISEMKSLLRLEGWTDSGQKWTRPGKKTGTSATLGRVAPNVFYVFTANGHPFEQDKAYKPFQVLALLKFNGDFTETAKSLVPERTEPVSQLKKKEEPISISDIDKILGDSSIDTDKQISEPPTILSIVEKGAMKFEHIRMFTLGNFSTIIGKAKTKKTFLLTMLASAILSNNNSKFSSGLSGFDKKYILWFDTEQGEFDAQNTVKRIKRLSGDISALKAFRLRPYSPKERCAVIERAFELWGNETALCVIDGVADLATAINDEDEATRVSSMFLRLTSIYNCHVTMVLHQNKNDNFATGWLGSAMMKKSELIVSVARNEYNKYFTDVNCDLSRGMGFEKFSFTINDGLPEVVVDIEAETKNHFKAKDKKEEFEVEVPIPEDQLPF